MDTLRRLAEQWRRRARETGMPEYLEIMRRTAEELDAEADKLVKQNDTASSALAAAPPESFA